MTLFGWLRHDKPRRRRPRGWIRIHEDACTGCGRCLPVCPMGGLALAQEVNGQGIRPARFLLDRCRGDAFCYRACPEPGAITVHYSSAA